MVSESSGLTPSRLSQGEYFTHNDSGDSARVFRFNNKGVITGTYSLKGATAYDWEDIASAHVGGKATLFVGDIGDNGKKRGFISVFEFAEPTGQTKEVVEFKKWDFEYPDGPRNAETLLVDPKTNDFMIVEKVSGKNAGIYLAERPFKPEKMKLKKLGEVTIGPSIGEGQLITGGAVSPDGRYVALRTYFGGFEFVVPKEGFRSWFNARPSRVKLAPEPQGEAITYSLDGRSMLTSSEKTPCVVSILDIKR